MGRLRPRASFLLFRSSDRRTRIDQFEGVTEGTSRFVSPSASRNLHHQFRKPVDFCRT